MARLMIALGLFISSFTGETVHAQAVSCDSNYFLNSYPDADSTFLIYDMALTAGDDVIVSGTITKRAIFPTEMHGVIFRVDKKGNKLWELYLSGAGRIFCRRILRLRDNNFLLAGFDQSGPSDFLMKISADGKVLWRKNILKTQSFGSSFNGLQEGADGSIYLACDREEGPASKGILFSKFDKAGNLQISKFHRLNSANDEITVRDMVITGGNSYVIGLLRKNVNQQRTHLGFLIRMNNVSCDLQWTKLYDFNGADQDFFQVFSYENSRLCILGRNPVSTDNTTNLLICDTTGQIENNRFFRFGQKSESTGIATMDKSGNLLYGNENKQPGSTDLTMFLINPFTGIQWAKQYPTLNTYPELNKLLYSEDGNIYAAGRIFSSGVFSFLGKFTSLGDMKCGTSPMRIEFGESVASLSSIDFAPLQKMFTIEDGKFPPASDQIRKGREVCQPAAACSDFSLTSLNAVCSVSDTLKLLVKRNTGCITTPEFFYSADSLRFLNVNTDTAEFIVLKTGPLSISAGLNGLCQTLLDTVRLFAGKRTENIFPAADTILCAGTTLLLDAGNGFNTYLWQNGSAESALPVSQPGIYQVSTTDFCGFNYNDSIVVVAAPSVFPDLGPDRELCGNSSVIISAPAGYNKYTWNNNSNGQTLTVFQPGNYWVEVKDINGCSGTDTVQVISKDCKTTFYVPNAFTPNLDGLNDVFKPLIIGSILTYKLTLFNRWGEIVFVSTDPSVGWDGNFKGKHADANLYTWTCVYELQGSSRKIEKGQVYLIR